MQRNERIFIRKFSAKIGVRVAVYRELSPLTIWRFFLLLSQLLNLAEKPDVFSQLHILWIDVRINFDRLLVKNLYQDKER